MAEPPSFVIDSVTRYYGPQRRLLLKESSVAATARTVQVRPRDGGA